ncbi:MAG: CHRD domain-containing protein [Acidobacteriota bacterium]
MFGVLVTPSPGLAQGAVQVRARLSTVPIDIAMQSTVAGRGTATATLAGRKLTVSGTFEGLRSPATVARLHVAPKGLNGPALFDLTVSAASGGTLSGSFELTPQQVEDLTAGRFYIQLHSEKAPDGNLRGWLLPQEARK